MSRYRFELAPRSAAVDAALRAILAATPMNGPVAVTFRREPSYFGAAVVHGDFHQAVVCRDTHRENRIIGFGSRSVRELYVNGDARPVGYLSMLRLLEDYRRGSLLARGFRYFRELHEDRRAPFYLTTIAEGNERAISTLTSGRGGLPAYRFAGRYLTAALPVPRPRRWRSNSLDSFHHGPLITIRQASESDIDTLLEFLHRTGSGRQFFPVYQDRDFLDPQGTFRDLCLDDLFLAFQDHRLVATLGAWDQRGFAQNVVEAYHSYLRSTRRLYNTWAKFRKLPELPCPGKPLASVTAVIPLVDNDDPGVFNALIDRLLERCAEGFRGKENPGQIRPGYLLLALHESDPLFPYLKQRVGRGRSYLTRLYQVVWPDATPIPPPLDSRPVYLELGCL